MHVSMMHVSIMQLKFCHEPTNEPTDKAILGVGCLGAQATPLVLPSRFLLNKLWLKSPWGKCRLGDVFGIFWETTASLDEAQVPKTLCNMLNLVDFLDKAASALDEAFPPNWLHEAGCMSPTTYDITPQNHQLSTTQFVKDQHGPS